MTDTTQTPQELRDKLRSDLVADMTSAVRDGLKSTEEAAQATTVRLEAIDTRIADLEAAGQRQNLPGSTDARGADGEKFSFGKVLNSLARRESHDPTWRKHAELEWEMSDQLRDQGVSPDNLGGFLVPGEVLTAQLIPLLRPRLIATMLGATEANFSTTPVDIPKEVSDPTVEALAENEAGTSSDGEVGQLRLEPHTAQSYIEASRRLLTMGSGAEGILTNMMAKRIAVTWNQWALKGTGGKQPVGIFNTAGIGSVDFSSVTIGANDVGPDFYQTMLKFDEALEDADAFHGAGKLGWAAPTKIPRAVRQVKSENVAAGTQSLDMSRNLISNGTEREMLGYRYETSTQLSNGSESELIFGDWEQLIMATFGNMILETSNVADDAMRKRQTHIIAAIDVDTAVLQPGAFAVSSGLNLTNL